MHGLNPLPCHTLDLASLSVGIGVLVAFACIGSEVQIDTVLIESEWHETLTMLQAKCNSLQSRQLYAGFSDSYTDNRTFSVGQTFVLPVVRGLLQLLLISYSRTGFVTKHLATPIQCLLWNIANGHSNNAHI